MRKHTRGGVSLNNDPPGRQSYLTCYFFGDFVGFFTSQATLAPAVH